MSEKTKVWAALATVYVIWGSTYLGIELAGETIPPMFAVSTRFIASGSLTALWVVWRRGRAPYRITRRELGAAILVGALLPTANGILFIAERHVSTGVSALIIGSVPLWLVLMRSASGDRPPTLALAGVGIGFCGLALLVRPGGGTSIWWTLLPVLSAVMWASGTFLASRLRLPADALAATSIEMVAGGVLMLPAGLLTSPHFADFSGRSIFGWFYLVTFGSIVGYTTYMWLLDHAPLGTVATYAYVNPVVAIALGAIVLHESLTWTTGIGAVLVLACVALVVNRETGRPAGASTSASPAGAPVVGSSAPDAVSPPA